MNSLEKRMKYETGRNVIIILLNGGSLVRDRVFELVCWLVRLFIRHFVELWTLSDCSDIIIEPFMDMRWLTFAISLTLARECQNVYST